MEFLLGQTLVGGVGIVFASCYPALMQSQPRPQDKPTVNSKLLETAQSLADKVASRADEVDEQRQLPADLARELTSAGLFRLLVPKTLDGAELDFPTFREIVCIFARADASTAWCVNQNNILATDSARMREVAAEEIWSNEHAVVTNGPPSPGTSAIRLEGGFRLSGHWDFSSGSDHATWLAARAPVEGESGEPLMFLLPKSKATMIDSWHVNGLRGTASSSFEIDDLLVPETHTYLESDPSRESAPIYAIPKIPLFAIGFATISVTLARESLNDVTELAKIKSQRAAAGSMRELATTHRQLGEAEAVLRAADAYLRQTAESLWQSACENGSVTIDERIEVRMASTYAIRKAAEVVDLAYDMFGSDGIFNRNAIQRRFQDMNVIKQQIQGRAANFETAGRYFVGQDPGSML